MSHSSEHASFLEVSQKWSTNEPRRQIGASDSEVAMEMVTTRARRLPKALLLLVGKFALLASQTLAHGGQSAEEHKTGASRPKRITAPQWDRI